MVIPVDAPFSGPRFEAFANLAKGANAHGSLIVGQVSHAGRQVEESIQPHPISASDDQLHMPSLRRKFGKPRAATREDINGVIEGFAHAAEFLENAGFDGIQLHAAHGYLLAQFLSRSTNHRDDEYGGSLENRMRLIFEIAAAVRKRVSETFVIGIKINAIELQEDGFNPEEATVFCQRLEEAKFDYVELSGGNYEKLAWMHVKESTKKRENFYIEAAEEIVKPLKSIKVYTTGGFKTLDGMLDALNVVDGVGIGKAACQEPRLPRALQSGKASGILKYAYSEEDYLKRLFASGSQIRQIAKNEEPVDLTVPENAEAVWEAIMGQWQRIAEDQERWTYGSPDLTLPAQPYAEPSI
ncbi:putative nadh oxidase protein [Phaeoacremonium minimum UCRPA7]|uniref:Putative nadh oxidase protein n=1 Tax=Phaeoacremonium minimum (strain UCR-PA7) TaxID=1286976 RepID=R8BXP3_PHAM7|nr:putative nadh oxidase protein [Phaeoacremonium minimum UCRPA7]EOO04171.1 putative nadh oxidase protein [Phaeoacremonium minimum UCRPA7]